MRRAASSVAIDGRQARAADSGVKAMIPVGRPFLDYVLGALADAGFRDICLVIGPEHDAICDYYRVPGRLCRLSVAFAIQEKPLGTADAVASAEGFAGEEEFLVINSDNYYPAAALNALRTLGRPGLAGFERDALVRDGNVDDDRVRHYAVLEVAEDGTLTGILEKPDPGIWARLGPRTLISMNCWRFGPAIFGAARSVGLSPRERVRAGGRGQTGDLPGGALPRGPGERGRARPVDARRHPLGRPAARPGGGEAVTSLLDRVRRALHGAGAAREACVFRVPGRIEVLGKHTDYAGGRSLVCAVDQGFVVSASPRSDDRVRVLNVAEGTEVLLGLDPSLPTPDAAWARYPATVLRRVARNFPDARRGADLAFLSDLPPAAGMSSSSALMVAIFLPLAALNRLEAAETYRRDIRSHEDLAGYLATVENGQSFGALTGDRGVGTFGGSEDHTAMLCGRAGELSQYSFCPVRHERQVAFPPDSSFVVAVSGVRAEKTGAAKDAYNRVSLAVRALVDVWRRASGRDEKSLAEAVERAGRGAVREAVSRAEVDGFDTRVLLDRFDQFVEESDVIVPAAGDALGLARLTDFGVLVDRSQELAERLLGNQVPETVALAREARELGAAAASAFGAGFGGSVWALVPTPGAEAFAGRWQDAYRVAFPERAAAAFLVTRPGPAASQVE